MPPKVFGCSLGLQTREVWTDNALKSLGHYTKRKINFISNPRIFLTFIIVFFFFKQECFFFTLCNMHILTLNNSVKLMVHRLLMMQTAYLSLMQWSSRQTRLQRRSTGLYLQYKFHYLVNGIVLFYTVFLTVFSLQCVVFLTGCTAFSTVPACECWILFIYF